MGATAAGGQMIDFGVTARDFAERYLEKRPYLRKAAGCGRPFDWAELDALLHRIEPRAPIVQLFNEGVVPEERYTDESLEFGLPRRRLNKHRFYDQLRVGATLVINRVESYSLPAQRLCAETGRFARRHTMSNGYLSCGGRGTFGRHWDTHDVFAVQLIGRKRWQLYPPTFPLPLGMHVSTGREQQCPAEPVLDCVLEPGDLLYVPRGWWHQAIPFEQASFHLSVGTYGPTVHDYLMWACARHLPEVERARRSLDDAVDPDDLAAAAEALRDIVLDAGRQAEFRGEIGSREPPASELNTRLFLDAGAEGLKEGATITLSSYYPLEAVGAELTVKGGRLRLSPLSRSVLEVLAVAPRVLLDALYDRLPDAPREAIRTAVLDLAQYEVVTIEEAPD